MAGIPEHDCALFARSLTSADASVGPGADSTRVAHETTTPCVVCLLNESGMLSVGPCVNNTSPTMVLAETVSRTTDRAKATNMHKFLQSILATEENKQQARIVHESNLATVPTMPLIPTTVLATVMYTSYCEAMMQGQAQAQAPTANGIGMAATSTVVSTVDIIVVYKTIVELVVLNMIERAEYGLAHPEQVVAVAKEMATGSARSVIVATEASATACRDMIAVATELTKQVRMIELTEVDAGVSALLRKDKAFMHLRILAHRHARARVDAMTFEFGSTQADRITKDAACKVAENLEKLQVEETMDALGGRKPAKAAAVAVVNAMNPGAPLVAEESPSRCRKRDNDSSSTTASDSDSGSGSGSGSGSDCECDNDWSDVSRRADQAGPMSAAAHAAAHGTAVRERDAEQKVHREGKERTRKCADTVSALKALSHTAALRFINSVELILWQHFNPSGDYDEIFRSLASRACCYESDMPVALRTNMAQFVMTAANVRLERNASHGPATKKMSRRAAAKMAANPDIFNAADLESLRADPIIFLGTSMMMSAANPDSDEHTKRARDIYDGYMAVSPEMRAAQQEGEDMSELERLREVAAMRKTQTKPVYHPPGHSREEVDYSFMVEHMGAIQLREDAAAAAANADIDMI